MPETGQKRAVIEALKNYPEQQKKIRLLRYELEHPTQVSEEELIESLSLSKSTDGGGPSGHISNKTMMIALQFQDEAQRMNSEVVIQIAQDLHILEAETARVDYYISLLDLEQAQVIRGYYLEKKQWADMETETGLTQRALLKRRDAGVAELSDMFEFLGRIRGEDSTSSGEEWK